MLADQPPENRPIHTQSPLNYTSQAGEHRPNTIGYPPYDMNRRPATSSQQKPGPYMSDNQGSESDSRSPKSLAVPTCVVAPSANQRRQDMEHQQEIGHHDNMEHNQDMEGEDSSGGLPYIPSRKQREFIPENRKDDGYWEKRRKNNEAARRSREKRRYHDMALENRIMDLTRDNCKLRNELTSLKKRFGMPIDDVAVDSSEHPGLPQGPTNMNNVSPNRSNPHMSQSILSSELQQQSRPPSSLHQSPPPRSKHPSGPVHPSHYLSFYNQQHNTPSQFTPAQISADAIYRGRSTQEAADMKHLFSGKFDAQSPISMKSMPEEVTVQQRRIEDQLRPMYSSSLPPNQAPPYPMNPLAFSSPKSYWVPTTEMTSSDSNDDSEWNDQIQDQPLSLVKKRPSTENESGSDLSNNSSRASTSPPTSSSSALPHKLRHKLTQEYVSNSMSPAISSYPNGLSHLSDIALSRQAFPPATGDDYQLESQLVSFRSRSRSYSNPRSQYDTKYVERRRKNNEAARKCRENRKSLTRIREVKSGYLENENNKLKDELGNLQDEMRELREMLEKKRQEKEMGSMSSEQQGNQRADPQENGERKDDRLKEVAVKVETNDVEGNGN